MRKTIKPLAVPTAERALRTQQSPFTFSILFGKQKPLVSILFLLTLLITLPGNLSAQEDFHFQVVDAESHNNIDSVLIYFPQLERKYRTDRFGRLVLHGEIAQGDSVVIRHPKYVTRKMILPANGTVFVKMQRLPIQLRDVEIVAYTQESRRFESPQTIHSLDANDFDRNSAASLQPTLNTIPGVLMESRGDGGSRRLSIRGSLMRSPFGVRNVKVYWNEFPLTIADGSTGLELIDPEEVGQVEVLKGPQGSVYGEGHGGAMLFRSKMAPYGKLRASGNFQGGSNGMQKQTLSFATSSKKTAINLNYFRYRHDGYRQQESVRKDQFNLVTRFRPESNREIKLFFMYYDGAWGLPGGVDSLTAHTQPRLAQPYAVENDTRVERKWIRVGLSNKIHFTDRFYNFSAGFLHSTSKLNPYGTNIFYNGYKDEGSNGYGLRTIFGYEVDDPTFGVHIMLGGEFQRDLNALAEFDLENGDSGDLRTSDETRSRYVNVFLKAKTHVQEKLLVDASLGVLTTLYDRDDLLADSIQDRSLRRHFEPVLLPMISMRYLLNEKYMVYALASRGVSTPTLWEIQASSEIEPERSDHYELGVRGSLFNDAILVTLNGYSTRIENAITEQPDSLGFSRFSNSGVIHLRGFESTIQYQLNAPGRLLSDFNLGFNLGIQRYEFESFVTAGDDFSGNEIPGVPMVNYSVTSDFSILNRFQFNTSYRFFDPVPLNNANTAWSSSYGLLDVRIGYRFDFRDSWFADVYFGVENALDERYSSFFRLNDNNGRYYNPQAGQTFYFGLKIMFEKENKLIR